MKKIPRAAGSEGLKGEDHPRHKLTTKEVLSIACSQDSTDRLARRYGVSPTTITRIRKGERWGDITGIGRER